MDELLENCVWTGFPDQPGGEIEVVIVEHDAGARRAIDLSDDGVGEQPVCRHVAGLPGLDGLRRQVAAAQLAAERVLHEPEQRVAKDAVVGAADLVRKTDEPQTAAVVQWHTSASKRHHLVAEAAGSSDPGNRLALGHGTEGDGNAAAGLSPSDSARRVQVVLDGAAVADQD